MTTDVATTSTLRISRKINAPRDRVFAAWTTPDDIMQWFAPETCQILSAKIDLRVGGEYQFRVRSEPFGELELRGVYREIKAPARLAYSWSWKGNPQLEFGDSMVTVDFVDRDGATEVQVSHEALPSEVHENHNHGWNGCLDKLQKHLGANAGTENGMRTGMFCWNELLAGDAGAATKFYTSVFGWEATDFGHGMNYTVLKKDGQLVAGLMQRPKEQIPPQWLAYVAVENIDQTIQKISELGGQVMMPPFEVPTIGRVTVFKDPQGASLALVQPSPK
jgi:predicted enzyme related to lactoylglutathione lyase/uncharacterized protein YndB with AHSA1/START domain